MNPSINISEALLPETIQLTRRKQIKENEFKEDKSSYMLKHVILAAARGNIRIKNDKNRSTNLWQTLVQRQHWSFLTDKSSNGAWNSIVNIMPQRHYVSHCLKPPTILI